MNQSYNLKQIAQPDFIYSLMREGKDKGKIKITFKQGSVLLPARHAIFNMIAWQVYFRLGIDPVVEDVIQVPTITDGALAKIHTKMYLRLLKVFPGEQWKCLSALADNVSDFSNFTYRWCGGYSKAISILGLCKLLKAPALKDLIEVDIPSSIGTHDAEPIINAKAKTFIELLGTPGAVQDNCLLDFMETKQLKTNQIPQVLMRYGCRADTDDTMMSHVINASTISGLRSIADYAVEGLGSKKSNLFAKTVIKDAQYFARRLRLVTAALQHLHPGDCGGGTTYPLHITKNISKHIQNKVIKEDGNSIVLDKSNISDYIDKTVDIVGVFGCKHQDGFCEACAGRALAGDNHRIEDISLLTAFSPPGQHIGIRASTEMGSVISQMILSAKHLIATLTKDYMLPDSGKVYLQKSPLALTWKKRHWKVLKDCFIHIPTDAMNSLSDLEFVDKVIPEAFSAIQHFEIRKTNGDLIDPVDLSPGEFSLCLSEDMLTHMAIRSGDINIEDDNYVIPLAGYPFAKPFINFVALNDDMVKFTRRVSAFFVSRIKKYNSLAKLMADLTELLYEKASVNLFYVEVVVRAFLIISEDDYRIPTVTDIEDVMCGTISEVITNREVSAKIAFEWINKYFSETATFTMPKSPGMYDNYIGLG